MDCLTNSVVKTCNTNGFVDSSSSNTILSGNAFLANTSWGYNTTKFLDRICIPDKAILSKINLGRGIKTDWFEGWLSDVRTSW